MIKDVPQLTENDGTAFRLNNGKSQYFIIPCNQLLLLQVKRIEEKLIAWCKQYKYSQGDSYHVFLTKKGKWGVSYTNDYPMQHGRGKRFLLAPEEFEQAMKLEI